MPLLEAYGMTEASHQIASNPLPPPAPRASTVGVAAGAEIRIADKAGGELPAGEAGEVQIRGAGVTSGYLGNPEANREAFVDGWFRTGDLGSLDGDGYLTLVGRLKEMILRGGENIAPAEVEDVLRAHPAVVDAACFGLPDAKYGELVAVAVSLTGRRRLQRADRPLPGAARGVQGAERDPHPRRDSADAHRQAPAPAHRGPLRRSLMRFAVVGAGAIGAYVGAALARGGADVTLIARGPHLRAMQEHGVRVQSARGDFHVHPPATDDFDAIGGADVVFLALKAHSLPEVADRIGVGPGSGRGGDRRPERACPGGTSSSRASTPAAGSRPPSTSST